MIAINENKDHSLDDVYEKIMTLEREDYAAPSKNVQVDESGSIILSDKDQSLTFPMTDFATEQMNQRWTGFHTFSRELERRGHNDLQRETLNELLSRDDRKPVIRTMKPNGERVARAVVSDSYKPIDDVLVIPPMLDVIGENAKDWRSLGGQVTDTNSYIRFISREPQITLTLNGNSRSLFIGFSYRNSEVGRGFQQFNAFLFDSFCENGCVFGSLTVADCKFMHKGSRIETQFGRIFEERVQGIEQAQIQGAIIEATRLTCEGRHVPEVRALLESSFEREVPAGKDAEIIRLVSKKVGLSDGQAESALVAYDGTRNQYGVQAAITKAAQDAPSYEARQSMEQAGGNVLSMTDKVWKSIQALA